MFVKMADLAQLVTMEMFNVNAQQTMLAFIVKYVST